jgi:CRISPR system Cascade subunit CasC
MTDFIQIHAFVVHAAANLNRDDLGRPKTTLFGNAQRLRISSQSLKRAWRTSSTFETAMEGHLSDRTRRMGELILSGIKNENDTPEEHAAKLENVKRVVGIFGKLRTGAKGEEGDIEQLAFVSGAEKDAATAMVARLVAGEEIKDNEISKILGQTSNAVDIGMFGRMLADDPVHNVEAAVQVAHAITTHKAVVENDYYTAVDDLKRSDEDRGAGHVGVSEFGSGVFYEYVCIDRSLLVSNLGGNKELADAAIRALVDTIVVTSPAAKKASYGSLAKAIYVMVEKGNQQPRNLAAAFLRPIAGEDLIGESIASLQDLNKRMDDGYGACADGRYVLDIHSGKGKLSELLSFVAE